MIKGVIDKTHVNIRVEGTAKELAEDVLRLTKAIYNSIMEKDGPLKLNASSFRLNIITSLDYVMRR